MASSLFDKYLKQWQLTLDGEAFVSLNGVLLPVRQRGLPAMLKISQEPEEQAGSLLMAWWDGDGAAPVLAHDREALLMERAYADGEQRPGRRGHSHPLCRCQPPAHTTR